MTASFVLDDLFRVLRTILLLRFGRLRRLSLGSFALRLFLLQLDRPANHNSPLRTNSIMGSAQAWVLCPYMRRHLRSSASALACAAAFSAATLAASASLATFSAAALSSAAARWASAAASRTSSARRVASSAAARSAAASFSA